MALDHTDDALLLEAGRVRAHGPTGEVLAPGRGLVEAVYGVTLVPDGALGFRLP